MTPTDTVVSEARRVLTECLDAFDDEVAEALMGGSEPAGSWPDIDVPVEALRTLLAIDRRTATPQSGGVVVKEEDWRDDPASDERWNAGVNYAITQLCEVLGVDPKSISWDAATETLDGDVSSVLCNAIRGAYGDDWTSDPAVTARIRSTLADPIPEAPADEEVEGLSLEKAVRDAHKTLMNTLDGDFGLWSSPAFAKAREAVYPLWKRLDETLIALRRSTETDSPVSKHDVLLAAAKHDLAYSEGFVSGWNSGLKTVSPDASDRARGHAASRAAERMGEDARAVIRVARSRSTETDKAVPAPATGGEDDEMYEIGKRDGYEEAVQDIDLLTGGDGEYRVSVFLEGGVDDDRHCPDPAAMKARIAERFAALRRPETDKPGVREAALEEAAKVADMFAADHAKSADQFGIDRNRELHNAAKGAAQGVAFAIRALSAPLAAEQPVADVPIGIVRQADSALTAQAAALVAAEKERDDFRSSLATTIGKLMLAEARVAELEAAGNQIEPYLAFAIGPESPGYHPTMPSAVASFRATLARRLTHQEKNNGR